MSNILSHHEGSGDLASSVRIWTELGLTSAAYVVRATTPLSVRMIGAATADEAARVAADLRGGSSSTVIVYDAQGAILDYRDSGKPRSCE